MPEAPASLAQFLGVTLESSLHRGVTYQLKRSLGQGGTAIAYPAIRHWHSGQSPVVIKMISRYVSLGLRAVHHRS